MAAPSTTKWGSIYGSYAKLGINVTTTSDNGYVYSTIQVWIWTKYSVSDSSNTLYFDDYGSASSAATSRGSKTIKTTVASGSGWSTSNQQLLYTVNNTYARAKTATTRYLYAKLVNVDRVGATMYANTTVSVPALPSYTVSYNANGGSGAPSSQTKWYGSYLTLSSTKPTRTGYTFQGWATSASGSVTYDPGDKYGIDKAITLYAVWKANTFTVKYNANGGSGAPSNQTKTYGVALTLSSTKPTRSKYTFKGWGTSASATTVSYAAGGSYTKNAAITLYAVWELAYRLPRIFNLIIERSDETGNQDNTGLYAFVRFDWESDEELTGIKVEWKSSSDDVWYYKTSTPGGTSGDSLNLVGGAAYDSDGNIIQTVLDPEISYDIRITLTDSGGTYTLLSSLPSMSLAIDVLKGNKGVAFGKTAEVENAAEFEFDAIFNGTVHGNVVGLNKLPEIPENSDFNDYMETGCWAVYKNAIAETITNIPINRAGRLEVISATGEGIRSEEWRYLRQRYIPYNSSNAVWERDIARNADNVWTYYDWWKSSLTPAAANKVYHTQSTLWTGAYYMTAGHTANLSANVSDQPNGIILLFQYYNNSAVTGIYTSVFIPKYIVPSSGSIRFDVTLCFSKFELIGTKALNVYNDRIIGHEANNATGTGSNISYNNSKFVLTHVIGV